MSWSDMRRFTGVFAGFAGLAGLTAGCFQPLYGERTTTTGGASLPAQIERASTSHRSTPPAAAGSPASPSACATNLFTI